MRSRGGCPPRQPSSPHTDSLSAALRSYPQAARHSRRAASEEALKKARLALLQNQLKRQLLGVPDNTPGREQAARSRREEPDMFRLPEPVAAEAVTGADASFAAAEESEVSGADGEDESWREWQVWGDSESEYELSDGEEGGAASEAAREPPQPGSTTPSPPRKGRVVRVDARDVDVFTDEFDALPLDIQYEVVREKQEVRGGGKGSQRLAGWLSSVARPIALSAWMHIPH